MFQVLDCDSPTKKRGYIIQITKIVQEIYITVAKMVKINKIEELKNRRNFFRNLEVLEIFLFRKFLVLDTVRKIVMYNFLKNSSFSTN